MKLKTLKGLNWKEQGISDAVVILNGDLLRNGRIALFPSSCQRLLKKEAINWVKEYEKEIKEHSHKNKVEPPLLECLGCRNKYVQLQWIKHFFNLTDEEVECR